MAAGNGMNMAVGLDLSQLQKDLKTLDKNLNSVVGQEKVIKIKTILEDEGKAMKGFESLHKAITELSDARANLKIDGNLVNDMSIKEAQKSLRQFRKELKDINSGKIADTSGQRATQLMANITNVGRWVNATKASAKELANIGWVDVDKQAAKAKAARSAIDKEMKRLRAEIDKLGNVSPADLKARESYLKRLINLQEQYNKTYARSPKKGTQALADLQHELQMTRSIGENNKLLNNQVKIFDRLKTLAARYVSIYTFAHFGRKIVEITGYFDQQRVALEGIVGSAEKANELLNQIKNFALQSPKTTKELIGYTKQLAAYSIPYEELFATTRRLADLSTGLGVDMQRLILAYGQVKAAAVLRGQELRQFTEAGIPMVQALADKFTKLNGTLVTTGEVFELISKRQVSFEMVKSVMEDMTNEGGKFYKMQENIVETLYGQVQKLSDVWTLSINKLGQSSSGTLMNIVHLLQKLAENIKPIFTGLLVSAGVRILGKAPKWFAGVNASVAQTRAQVADLNRRIAFLNTHMQRLKANGMAFTKSMQMANAQMRSLKMQRAAIGANVAFGILAVTIGAVVTAIKAARRRTEEFNNTIHEIESASAKETQKLKDGLDGLISKLRVFNEGTKEYNKAIDTLKSNYGDYINEDLIEALIHERDALGETVQSWNSLHDAIIASIEAKKEYDRHVSLSEAKGNAASQDLTNTPWYSFLSTGSRSVSDEFINALRNNHKGETAYHPEYIDISRKGSKEANAVDEAVKAFFEKGISYEYDTKGNLIGDPFEDFKKRLKEAADLYADGSQEVILDFARMMFDKIQSNDYYKKFEEEQRYLAKNPRSIAERRWTQAERDASNAYEGRWSGNQESRKLVNQASTDYDPRTWKKNAQVAYKDALKDVISAWGRDVTEMYNSASTNDDKKRVIDIGRYNELIAKYNDEITNFSASDVEQSTMVANVLTELIGAVADPDLRARLSEARQRYVELAGTITGVSKTIAQNISDNFGKGAAISVEQKDFFERYSPTEETVESNRNALREMYQKNLATIESHRNDSVWKDVVVRLQQQNDWIKILAGKQYYDIVDLEKKSGSGGSKGDFTRFFADLFGMLKSAYNDQKKLIEGPEGVTNALIESIQGLSDDNILKGFYKDAANPFQKYLDKIADYDIETIFNANDFKDVMNKFQGNVGVDKVSVADFEDVWNQLLEVIRKKSVELRAAGRSKEASKIEAYLQTMTAEGLKFFGRDEIENKIEEAIRSLTAIQEAARLNSEQYEDMRAMMKTGNYQQIYGLFNPGQEYKDRNEIDVAKQTLSSMLAPTTPGGKGINSFIGEDIDKILKAEQLGISFIPELYNIINKIGNIGDELKDADGRVIDAKELQNVKDTFIKALKDLINGIKSETQKLSETRTKQEATTDKMYEAQQKYIDKINLLNKAHETGITETVNGEQKTIKLDDEQFTQRSTEALQEFTKSLSESLGGQFNTAIAQVTGDSGSATGSSGFGDLMQMMSSMQNGGLQSMIGTGLGQSAASGSMSMGAAAGAAGAAGGAIALIDIIIKAVYSSIKGMADIAKATLKVMKSFDDVSEVNIDEAGVMHIDTVYGDYNFEKANAIIDTVQQYNQHVMDGWEKAKSGDMIGSIYEIYSSITDLITSIREIADMDLQKKIEKMQDCTDDLRNAATNLSAAAERLVGFDKVATKLEATGKSLSMAAMYQGMIAAEYEKKNSDGDKMQEWQQEYEQLMNDFYNGLYELRNEMVKSTEDWASQMGDAIRGAFQNGENAARAFRDTVKTMMGDVIEQMLQMAILEPLIESAIQNWTNSDYLKQKYTKSWVDDEGITHKDFDSDNYLKELLENIGDPDKAENFYQSMLMIGDTLIDTVNGMPSVLQDFYKYNSELGTLSGGIESVTEDTARRIEALDNSQLGELFAIRTLLEQYLGSTGGFGDSTMSSVQAAVVSIASDTSLIRIATDAILNQLNELRTSPARPLHVTMV